MARKPKDRKPFNPDDHKPGDGIDHTVPFENTAEGCPPEAAVPSE